MSTLRSAEWFDRLDELGMQHRAVLRQAGIDPERAAGKPLIAIFNNWSELNPCNLGLRELAAEAKRGVEEAGGTPIELNTLTLGEELMKPSAMLYRNLLSMEVEEALRSYPIDGCLLLGGCDKTLPGMLLGAVSANLPCIVACSGPKLTGNFRGEQIGSGTALWKYGDQRRLGEISDADWRLLEEAYAGTVGTCNVMGTASSVALAIEALGLMLPGGAAIPAVDPRRRAAVYAAGRRAVELAKEGLCPMALLTAEAFANAAKAALAAGGSTNLLIHLLALARRCRAPLELADFDRWSREIPTLLNLQPAGAHLMEAFDRAGGVPALFQRLSHCLNLSCKTVSGFSWREELGKMQLPTENEIVRPITAPVQQAPGLAILYGNLCPRGAVLRLSTASPRLYTHTGPAVVFNSYEEMLSGIDAADLEASADSVLVLRHAGAAGVPGMPEWGNIPIPAKLLRAGVRDMVRISDARMSGTASGTVILHASPEAARGGLLGIVQDGDLIRLDTESRKLDLLIDPAELQKRLGAWQPPKAKHLRGYPALYAKHVLGSEDGCDFDFLVPSDAESLSFVKPTVGRS